MLIVNATVITVVLAVLLYYQWRTQRFVFYGTMITFFAALAIELGYRRVTNRKFKKRSPSPGD